MSNIAPQGRTSTLLPRLNQTLPRSPPMAFLSIEKVRLDLSRLMQHGADQDKTVFHGVENRVCLRPKSAKAGRNGLRGTPNAG